MENWKAVEGYEGFYEVSDLGRVRSVDRYVRNSRNGELTVFKKSKVKKPTTTDGGYETVTLNREGEYHSYYVHRLVASAFVDNPNGYEEVNHIDEDKHNNRASNLEWCTKQYNIHYGTRTTRAAKRQSRPVLQCSEDGTVICEYPSLSSVKSDGFNPSNVKAVCDGKFSQMNGYGWRWSE